VRLLSADWVLPVCRPPLRAGAVLVDGPLVAEVGEAARLAAGHPEAVREHFEGCVLSPGLVNAHTHLTLSALAGVVPRRPFAEWLPLLVAALKPWEIADHEASGVIGAEESLRAGVTVVGDIAYGAAEVASASRAGLGGVYYWEVLGVEGGAVESELARLGYPTRPDAFGPRAVCGLSPHSAYTAGPGLQQAMHAKAAELGVPLAIHVSESQAETDLLRDGSGPLAGVAGRTARGFTPSRTTTVRYLDAIGVLSDITAVHLCYLGEGDVDLLGGAARGVVTCPRSNRYLSNPPPDIAPLLAAGLPVGAGTDSSASNDDLNLMAEVRAIHEAEPDLSADTLVRLATLGGAQAIGVEERFGSLQEGKQADLAVFSIQAAEDTLDAFVRRAGRDTLRAVMSGGEWRVRDGRLLTVDPLAAARATDARRRSLEALQALG